MYLRPLMRKYLNGIFYDTKGFRIRQIIYLEINYHYNLFNRNLFTLISINGIYFANLPEFLVLRKLVNFFHINLATNLEIIISK